MQEEWKLMSYIYTRELLLRTERMYMSENINYVKQLQKFRLKIKPYETKSRIAVERRWNTTTTLTT